MRLKDAVALYQREAGAYSNSYDWYRRSAQELGQVTMSSVTMPARKVGNVWHVPDELAAQAIASHRARLSQITKDTSDFYEHGIIRSNQGRPVELTNGSSYTVLGDFYEVRSLWLDRGTTWYCGTCNKVADLEHAKEECHRCRDWSGCGEDCTLSRVACSICGKERAF